MPYRQAVQISRADFERIREGDFLYVYELIPKGATPRLLANPATGLYVIEYE